MSGAIHREEGLDGVSNGIRIKRRRQKAAAVSIVAILLVVLLLLLLVVILSVNVKPFAITVVHLDFIRRACRLSTAIFFWALDNVWADNLKRRSLGPLAVKTLLWRPFRPMDRTRCPLCTSTISPTPAFFKANLDEEACVVSRRGSGGVVVTPSSSSFSSSVDQVKMEDAKCSFSGAEHMEGHTTIDGEPALSYDSESKVLDRSLHSGV
ncbi:hypothetical protein AKJ16_DCAP14748 [Drosera capensis]